MKIKKTFIFLLTVVAFSAVIRADSFARDAAFNRRVQSGEVLVNQGENGVFERKRPGFFVRRHNDSPKEEQLMEARKLLKAEKYSRAAVAFDILVRSYPFSREAAEAQADLTASLYIKGDYKEAFDECKYLLKFYPENAPVVATLERMFKIANHYRSKGSMSRARIYFSEIAEIAPSWDRTPEVLFSLGLIEMEKKNYYEAADAFDRISSTFPESSFEIPAAKKHAIVLYKLALKYKEDEALERRAISLCVAALKHKRGDDTEEVRRNLNELTARKWTRSYETARFYDTERYDAKTKIAAYENFLRTCPLAPQVGTVKKRLGELGRTPSDF